MKLIDLTGQIFGRLTVVGRDMSRTERPVHWICRCTCGKTVSVAGQDLKSGNSKSCGCLNREITSRINSSNLIGQKFGRLTVIERSSTNGHGGQTVWICKCDCGKIATVLSDHLKTGHTRSCGCLQKERASETMTKWKSKDEQEIADRFRDMKKRCTNPKNKEYHRYGGRGIEICKEWIEDRSKFIQWSLSEGGYAPGLTIERKNNDGPYAPWNCCWIPKLKQAGNKSTNVKFEIDGEVKTIAEWARVSGLSYEPLRKLFHSDPAKFMDKVVNSPGFDSNAEDQK